MGGGENNNPKTPEERLAELTAGDRSLGGRKLKFNDQCAVFALLYGGLKNRFVARAFGLSATTVSNIGGCLNSTRIRASGRWFTTRARASWWSANASATITAGATRIDHGATKASRANSRPSAAAFNRRLPERRNYGPLERAKAEFGTEKRNPLPAPTKKLAEMSGQEIREWRELHPGLEPSDYFG